MVAKTKSETLIWNKKAECMSRKDLQELQTKRLAQVLQRVYKAVPFYQKRFDEAKVGSLVENFKNLSDLKSLPFTYKYDLRNNYPFGLFAEPLTNVRRIHASSGTKGKPTVVGYTANDLETWKESCARSLACAGAKPEDIIHNAYGYGLFTGGLGMHYGIEHFGATVIPASGGRTQQQILLLQDFKARILLSTPSYALNIAYHMEEHGIDLSSIALEIGIFGAEPWTEELRKQIEARLKIKALDIYGLSEIMGPGVSMECVEGRNGLHVWEDFFLPEIIDPKTGEPLPEGEEGELVFTNIQKEAIPVIRYRTGDISRLYYETCRCGRTMARMERVRARLDDMLIIRGVNVYPSEIEQALLSIDELAPHYQLVVNREKALDVLEVQVEISEEIVARWGEFHEGQVEFDTLTQKIQKSLKENMGLTADVKLMKPRTVPRSEGKAVRVVDLRSNINPKAQQ